MATDKDISFSLVTGASSGIGKELARVAAERGSDLLIVSDTDEIYSAATELGRTDRQVIPVQADLSTKQGIDALYDKARDIGRPIDALFANAGRGLGQAFLDQNPADIQRVIDTNVSGTVYLLHRFVNDMRRQGWGRVLITGSIAGMMPGTYQAIYNASKAFVNSFAYALRHELSDTGVTITVLMPGATESDFFETADILDTKLGAGPKDDPAIVAKAGYDAMLRGDGHEVSGFANKLQAAMTRVLNDDQLAKMHEGLAKPGSAGKH
jgi:short-subunit dehydrogenase